MSTKNGNGQSLLENVAMTLLGDYIDPGSPLYDDGERWVKLGMGEEAATFRSAIPYDTDEQLRQIRLDSRALALHNEFAINAAENRINYVVEQGHKYEATPAGDASPSDELLQQVQEFVDDFITENNWSQRQQENQRRLDRDGEVFLRFFLMADGMMRVRYVEPGQVVGPPGRESDPAARFGVLTDPDDVETVLGYWLAGDLSSQGEMVSADQIQHRKANVDSTSKRGLPLFYPIRKNLRRAERLLRNMSVVAEVQSAIALIRKHGGSKSAVQDFVAGQGDLRTKHPDNPGRAVTQQRFGPGTILDAAAGIEYEMPVSGVRVDRFVEALQAELRAIASRLVMPEFMLTSDASNANFSSTMVAEGPAVKMFARLQGSMVASDLDVMRKAIEHAVTSGRLPAQALTDVEVNAEPPRLTTRNRLEETQLHQVLANNRILSPQTWSQKEGLDYDREQGNLEQHADANDLPTPGEEARLRQRQGEQGRSGQDDADDEDASESALPENCGIASGEGE